MTTTEQAAVPAVLAVPSVPYATVSKSRDPQWVRWAVSARDKQTEWFKSEAKAVKDADALCRARGSITWTEYVAAQALREQQIKALPELIAAAKLAYENGGAVTVRLAAQAALKKAGVL